MFSIHPRAQSIAEPAVLRCASQSSAAILAEKVLGDWLAIYRYLSRDMELGFEVAGN